MRDSDLWMWSEACAMLARADRLHQQFFQLRQTQRAPAWEPPIDLLETEDEVRVLVALPGVDPDQFEAALQDGALLIAGRRTLPAELRTAVIHRLELPQGRFERRIPLPPGRYAGVHTETVNGCFVLSLRKTL